MIIQEIESNEHITREELSNICGVSINTIKKHIIDLKETGLLERVGGRKDGIWKIL